MGGIKKLKQSWQEGMEEEVGSMVKYLRLAWEHRQARGIFRVSMGEPAHVPHAVCTSYRPLDVPAPLPWPAPLPPARSQHRSLAYTIAY